MRFVGEDRRSPRLALRPSSWGTILVLASLLATTFLPPAAPAALAQAPHFDGAPQTAANPAADGSAPSAGTMNGGDQSGAATTAQPSSGDQGTSPDMQNDQNAPSSGSTAAGDQGTGSSPSSSGDAGTPAAADGKGAAASGQACIPTNYGPICVNTSGGASSPPVVLNCQAGGQALGCGISSSAGSSATSCPAQAELNGAQITLAWSCGTTPEGSSTPPSPNACIAYNNASGITAGWVCSTYKDGKVVSKSNCIVTLGQGFSCNVVRGQGPDSAQNCPTYGGAFLCTTSTPGVPTVLMNCTSSGGLNCLLSPSLASQPAAAPPSPLWQQCSLPGGGSGWVQKSSTGSGPAC
jgi:hypothetical protein